MAGMLLPGGQAPAGVRFREVADYLDDLGQVPLTELPDPHAQQAGVVPGVGLDAVQDPPDVAAHLHRHRPPAFRRRDSRTRRVLRLAASAMRR